MDDKGITLEIFEGAFSLISNYPTLASVLIGLSAIVASIKVIVKLTSTKKDDEFLAKVMNSPVGKILSVIDQFASFKKSKK